MKCILRISFSLLSFLRGKQCACRLKKLEGNREKEFGILRFQGKRTCAEPCWFSPPFNFLWGCWAEEIGKNKSLPLSIGAVIKR